MTDSQKWMLLVVLLMAGGIVYLLTPVLMPFLTAFLLAYLLNPFVDKLQTIKVPRWLSATLLFSLVLILIIAFVLRVIPTLERQFALLIAWLPKLVQWIQQTAVPFLNEHLHLDLQINVSSVKATIINHIQGKSEQIIKQVVNTLFTSGYVAVEMTMNIILIPVVTIYILSDWDKITKQGLHYLPLPSSKKPVAQRLIKECGDVLAGFFRGQLLVMLSLAILYYIGLTIVGIELAVLIAITAGLLSVVPYLGFFGGILIAISAALMQHPDLWHVGGVIVVFAIGQLCESFVFSPMFIGDKIGLHPIAVIFAILAGGQLFGFVGILIALPAAAVIMVFFRHWQYFYLTEDNAESQLDDSS